MKRYRPLEGVRVLSFEVAASLPAGTRTLADLGADVVRVAEPAGQTNPFIRVFDSSLINKRSIVLNLRQEAARRLALELVAAADVVCSNFRPHVLPQFGLDYATLAMVKPSLIVVQLTGYGTPGPWQDFPAYGPSVEAAGGINSLMGAPDELPQRVGGGVFADTLAGRYAALAICAALVRRDIGEGGRFIDASMYECIVTGIGDQVVRAGQEGTAPRRMGNRAADVAPQGIYPCAGRDEWIALTVGSDTEWQTLKRLIGDPSLDGPALDTVPGRLQAHDEIDRVLAAWTCTRDKATAAEQLQDAGIAAGPVLKTGDVPSDPQHRARGFFQQVEHDEPILGYRTHPHMRLPGRATGRARPRLSDHHPEGGDAASILADWLRLSEAQIEGRRAEGAFGEPRPVVPPGSEPPGWFGARHTPHDEAFAARLGLRPAARPR